MKYSVVVPIYYDGYLAPALCEELGSVISAYLGTESVAPSMASLNHDWEFRPPGSSSRQWNPAPDDATTFSPSPLAKRVPEMVVMLPSGAVAVTAWTAPETYRWETASFAIAPMPKTFAMRACGTTTVHARFGFAGSAIHGSGTATAYGSAPPHTSATDWVQPPLDEL